MNFWKCYIYRPMVPNIIIIIALFNVGCYF